MIHLGFNLHDPYYVDIVALDDNFIFISDKSMNSFYYENTCEFRLWLDSIRLYDEEDISCFLCERQFLSQDIKQFEKRIYQFLPANASIFLVRDRMIQNLYILFENLSSAKNFYSTFISISFLLAASRNLIEQKYIYQFKFSNKNALCKIK